MNSKIAHFAPAATNSGGGIAEVIHGLLPELVTKRRMLIIVSKPFVTEAGYCDEYIMPQWWNIGSWMHLFASLRGVDVLHIHGAWTLHFIYLAIYLLFFLPDRQLVVYQPHGLVERLRIDRKSKLKKTLALKTYMGSVIKRSDKIIACSRYESDGLKFFCDPQKIAVIPNGINSQFFRTPQTSIEQRSTSLVFLSQIIPIKGVELVIEAIYLMRQTGIRDVSLDIYGYGDQPYIAELRTKVKTLELSGVIKFLGPVDRVDRVSVYDTYQSFILPSYHENFGIAVVEALSRNCIVLVSKATPWGSVKYKRSLVSFSPNVNGVVNAILSARALSKQKRLEMNKSGARVASRYTWQNAAKELTCLYNS